MWLTSLDRMRNYIEAGGTVLANNVANNRNLSMWITSVSSQIENFLNRSLHIESRTEYFDVTYEKKRFGVKGFPISSITSVYEDSEAEWSGTSESILESTEYCISADNRAVELIQSLGFVASKALRVIYLGGLAYHATQSTFAVTKSGTWTAGRYVTGGTSGAVGLLVSTTATVMVVNVLYGVFSVGETLTESTTEGGTATVGISATLDSVTYRALCEAYPEIVTACEMEVRYLNQNKLKFEDTGMQKDSTSRRGAPASGQAFMLQPETMAMLNPYRHYHVGEA